MFSCSLLLLFACLFPLFFAFLVTSLHDILNQHETVLCVDLNSLLNFFARRLSLYAIAHICVCFGALSWSCVTFCCL